MRLLAFGLVSFGTLLGLGFGCGQSDSDGGGAAAAGNATAGSSPSGAGMSGSAGGSATAGSGSNSGGSAAGGVASAGFASGGRPDAPAGAGNDGGTGAGLVDCDPTKIMCKRLAPECDAGEVPRVEGGCYGECVKIDQCACRSAEQCPQPNEYTCWAKQHCGPFVQ
jgi:hypothetical protein